MKPKVAQIIVYSVLAAATILSTPVWVWLVVKMNQERSSPVLADPPLAQSGTWNYVAKPDSSPAWNGWPTYAGSPAQPQKPSAPVEQKLPLADRIEGKEFSMAKALENEFGNYDAVTQSSVWRQVSLPPSIDGFFIIDNYSNGADILPILSKNFTHKNGLYHLLLTAAEPAGDHDTQCHACEVPIGFYIYKYKNNGWNRIVSNRAWMGSGSWGYPCKFKTVILGVDHTGVLESCGDMHNGVVSSYHGLHEIKPQGLIKILELLYEDEDVSFHVLKSSYGGYAKIGVKLGKKPMKVFRFRNGKYRAN